MVIEVVVFGAQCRRAIDFEQSLSGGIVLSDAAVVHLPHLLPGVLECRPKHWVSHELRARPTAAFPIITLSAGRLARQQKSESRASWMGKMPVKPLPERVGAADVKMLFSFRKHVDAPCWQGHRDPPVPERLHRQQFVKLWRQRLDQPCELLVHRHGPSRCSRQSCALDRIPATPNRAEITDQNPGGVADEAINIELR